MVANPTGQPVGGGRSITDVAGESAGRGRAGISESKMVHIRRWSIGRRTARLSRPRSISSKATRRMPCCTGSRWIWSAASGRNFDAIELYSCFPCRAEDGATDTGVWAPTCMPTVTGGLTFFGAPLNDLHERTPPARWCARCVTGVNRLGLLYAQGGFVTKHHAVVLSSQAPTQPLSQETSVQAAADAANHQVPGL